MVARWTKSLMVILALAISLNTLTTLPRYNLNLLSWEVSMGISTKLLYSRATTKNQQLPYGNATDNLSWPFEPLWDCPAKMKKSTTTNKKLIFIHIFKTAGSTMRAFFRAYAKQCLKDEARFGEISRCTNIQPNHKYSKHKPWTKPCGVDVGRRDTKRPGKFKYQLRPVTDDTVMNKFDVMGGHWRLGSVEHLVPKNQTTTREDWHYVTFVRNAAQKYVSGKVYMNEQKPKSKQQSEAQIVKMIQKEVTSSVSKRQYHEKYEHYLLTPRQRQLKEKEEWSRSRTNQVMKDNLVSYRVTVGVTEYMTESMALLQYLLDPLQKVSSLFQAYGGGGLLKTIQGNNNTTTRHQHPHYLSIQNNPGIMLGDRAMTATNTASNTTTTSTSATGKKINVSKLSSSAILRQLKQNTTFYAQLLEYVKYEQEITDFAISLHLRQYRSMIESLSTP